MLRIALSFSIWRVKCGEHNYNWRNIAAHHYLCGYVCEINTVMMCETARMCSCARAYIITNPNLHFANAIVGEQHLRALLHRRIVDGQHADEKVHGQGGQQAGCGRHSAAIGVLRTAGGN